MRFRYLGCDGGIAWDRRAAAYPIQDDVLIDAPLKRVTDVLLTHARLYRAGCLPPLIDAALAARAGPLIVCGTTETVGRRLTSPPAAREWPRQPRQPARGQIIEF